MCGLHLLCVSAVLETTEFDTGQHMTHYVRLFMICVLIRFVLFAELQHLFVENTVLYNQGI